MSRRMLQRALWVSLIPALLCACMTRKVDERYYQSNTLEVSLRSIKRGTSELPQGYAHPVVISSERISHILALIDAKRVDGKVEEREAVIKAEMLEPISVAVSGALAAATPNQRVVVSAIERRRSKAIFIRRYLTTFIAFAKDDELYLDFSRVHWEIPKNREDNLPKPELGERAMNFRIAGSQSMRNAGTQTLAVQWREDVFRKALAVRREGTSGVRRRTVIMDSPTPRAAGDGRSDPLPAGLSPDSLRELADLEEARRRGDITEGEYQKERRRLLGDSR